MFVQFRFVLFSLLFTFFFIDFSMTQMEVIIEYESIEFARPNSDDSLSQIANERDSVVYTFYFADGFEDEEIRLANGFYEWIYGIPLQKSNPYYGLTGTELWITKGQEFIVMDRTGEDDKVVVRKQMTLGHVKDDGFSVYVIDRTGNYKYTPNLQEGNHIVVYRKWNSLFFSAFKEVPGFD